ncbi:Hypothetical protein Ccan_07390 [Capnocytophaga canimorsus Cc5]|uniref:Uncharacterized protein n=2 Tax=Capnocytophaga canimorsus TaxID=28188 RepID=F9YTJ7_CAPCC|nr:Hypothetical protein Ccan_07390 [Capnocytophaga canimorsus Cc5]
MTSSKAGAKVIPFSIYPKYLIPFLKIFFIKQNKIMKNKRLNLKKQFCQNNLKTNPSPQ